MSLRRTPAEAFCDVVLRAARERGIAIEPAELEAAIDTARNEWLLRWVR